MKLNIIVAICKENRGIGLNNKLPWNYPEDLKYFSRITKGNGNNAIIMGRNTFESIGKTLPKRTNIILSKTLTSNEKYLIFENIIDSLSYCKSQNFDEVFIIGGESIYNQTIHLVDSIYVTEINKYYSCDTFFPEIPNHFKTKILNLSSDKDLTYVINY